MQKFLTPPKNLRLLVCADVDIVSAARLSEKFVPLPPQFDGVVIIGPFVQTPLNTEEECAVALGDMASIIAQFENIVCRVIYLPSETDPPSALIEQLHLTPNSVGIHGRKLHLTKDLYVKAYTEKGDDMYEHQSNVRPMRDTDDENDIDNVEVSSGISISIIQDMLQDKAKDTTNESSASSTAEEVIMSKENGVFVFNYHYAHTLNHFLFHMTEELEQANIDLCIISSTKDNSATRLPKKFGKMHIAVPQSLRCGGHYTVIDMAYSETEARWTTQSIELYKLDSKE
jgi:hypothetical protein